MIANDLESINWEFVEDETKYFTHAYHPYSSKYIPQIPYNLINLLSKKNEAVLDPFLGSGTTLVEAKLLGRNGFGVDINPLARLISKVKTTPIEPTILKKEVSNLKNALIDKISSVRAQRVLYSEEAEDVVSKIDNMRFVNNIQSWFQRNVILELFVIREEIYKTPNRDIKDFLLVAFSSIIRTVSDAASGYGNLMINKNAPQKRRIFETFLAKLDKMIEEMEKFYAAANRDSTVEIIQYDSRLLTNIIPKESIDFICTHPPYMAAVPYAEYQKLQLWWQGYDPRKLDFEIIGGMRSRPDTPERFESSMRMVLSGMYEVLKFGKYCAVVIGNPVYKGKLWNLNEMIIEQGKDVGFELEKEIIRGKYRTTMGKMKAEYIIILRKT